MSDRIKKKREAGQTTQDGNWLVLSESMGNKIMGYTHKCGAQILFKKVAHAIGQKIPQIFGHADECAYAQVPYCPRCEKAPDPHGAPIVMFR